MPVAPNLRGDVAEINVKATGEDDQAFRFDVDVTETGSTSHHDVTLSRSDLEELGMGSSPEDFVRRSFEFLLEREPKESILSRFDISQIATYFPEFKRLVGG
jgi:hypothetical protein